MKWCSVFPKPDRVTRLIQPIGYGNRDFRWRNGFLMRLPGKRVLLVCLREEGA